MSLLDTNLDNIPDLEIAVDGSERVLTITQAQKVAKKERPNISNYKIKLEDSQDPRMDDVYVYLTVPDKALREENEKEWIKAANRLKQFAQCFGIPINSIDEDTMRGYSGRCMMGVENDAVYGQRNVVREYLM